MKERTTMSIEVERVRERILYRISRQSHCILLQMLAWTLSFS